jgi:hypothetical protein
VQGIDAAAMSLWLSYRHLSFSNNIPANNTAAVGGLEGFQYVKLGSLIDFRSPGFLSLSSAAALVRQDGFFAIASWVERRLSTGRCESPHLR